MMSVVQAPQYDPGCDFVTRATPNGPFIDTGYEDLDDERYYVSKSTLREMVRLMIEVDEDFAKEVANLVASVPEGEPQTPVEAGAKTPRPKKPSPKGDPVKCPVCGEEKASKFALAGHMKKHEKEGAA